MPHRYGEKSRGSHTTCTDLTARVYDIAVKLQETTGVALGELRSGKGVSGGSQRVRFDEMSGGLLLTVRQSRSLQDVRVYCADVRTTRLVLARALRNEGIPIAFRH